MTNMMKLAERIYLYKHVSKNMGKIQKRIKALKDYDLHDGSFPSQIPVGSERLTSLTCSTGTSENVGAEYRGRKSSHLADCKIWSMNVGRENRLKESPNQIIINSFLPHDHHFNSSFHTPRIPMSGVQTLEQSFTVIQASDNKVKN